MMDADIGIKGGIVFNGKELIGRANVYIKQGKIVEVSKENRQVKIEVNAEGKFVMPGLIDAHIHLSGIKGGSLLRIMFEKPEYRVLRASKWLEKITVGWIYNCKGLWKEYINSFKEGCK
jgi:imidazolonepropionase-like amidohydrolase